jgi:hypothetical protein
MSRRRRDRLTAEQRRAATADRQDADALAMALRFETNPDRLAEHATHRWSHVRGSVAKNLYARQDTLLILARDPWEWTRAEVAANENSPEDALLLIARSKRSNWTMLVRVLSNPARTPAVMTALSARRSQGVSQRVAIDPLTPTDRVRRYLKSTRPDVVAAALANPALPEAAALLPGMPATVIDALLYMETFFPGMYGAKPQLTDPVLNRLTTMIGEMTASQRISLARHAQARPDMLDALALHDNDDDALALTIVSHSACPEHLLARYAMSTNPTLRRRAAAHPACPEDARVAEALFR